jgi:hypothetical protein
VIWLAKPDSGSGNYLAVFNISSAAENIHYDWKELGLVESGLGPQEYQVRDLWEEKNLGPARSLDLKLASHACALYKVSIQ